MTSINTLLLLTLAYITFSVGKANAKLLCRLGDYVAFRSELASMSTFEAENLGYALGSHSPEVTTARYVYTPVPSTVNYWIK